MSYIKKLKKESTNSVSALREKIENSQKNDRSNDFWEAKLDAKKEGFAVIRFLPPVEGETSEFVKLYRHWFKGPGGIYDEKSRTTIGQSDPVADYNNIRWEAGYQDEVRDRKRRVKYIANIVVLQHALNPEDEGKVFQFQFGQKIFEKLVAAMEGDENDPDIVPINPFCLFEGANFKLRIGRVQDYANYDKSGFQSPSALFDGDEKKLEEIMTQAKSLEQYIDPKTFKSYDELQTRFNRVVGLNEVLSDMETEVEEKTTSKSRKVKDDDADIDIDELLNFDD